MHIDELIRPHRRCRFIAHNRRFIGPLMDVPMSLILVKTHYRLVPVGEMAKNNYRYDKSYFLLLSIAR
jgi:hypothetical protein